MLLSSGVSTLLKTIAGQVHGLEVGQKTVFNYQGRFSFHHESGMQFDSWLTFLGIPWDIMHSRFRGEVIYQAESDIHFPQLTVGETLYFAALARAPKNRLPGATRKQYAEHVRDVTMAVLGLLHTMHTKLGNDYIRGVSGGEKKRVSIAEAILNRSVIQCWDNSTRGLDSETALGFVRWLRLSTELGRTVAIVSMYQASQAAYDASFPYESPIT